MATAANTTNIIVNDALENLVFVLSELQRPLYRLLAAAACEAGLLDALGAHGDQLGRDIGRFEFEAARRTSRAARSRLESEGRK